MLVHSPSVWGLIAAFGGLGRSRAPFTLASHPAIEPFMCGGNCITPRAAGLREGLLWPEKRQQCPLIPTEASPDHKLNVLVDHEVGCCGTDVPTGSTQTRRHRCRWMGWSSASDRDGKPRFRVTTSPSFVSALTAYSISYTHALLRILDPRSHYRPRNTGRPWSRLMRRDSRPARY